MIFHRINTAAVGLTLHAIFFAELEAAFEAALFFEIGEEPFWGFFRGLGGSGGSVLLFRAPGRARARHALPRRRKTVQAHTHILQA